MTKPKPLPEILPGPDGAAKLYRGVFETSNYVRSGLAGWCGPIKPTPRGAILAWNRVMAAYHAAKKGATK